MLHRRVLLSSTMLVAAVAGYGRRAYGACVNTVGSTYVCSGYNNTTQLINGANANNASVSTVAGFSVNTAAGNAITITGDGALSYTDINNSPLTTTAPGYATLYVKSTGDQAVPATPGSVTIDTNGTLSGFDGINAQNNGAGAVSITANGNVSGANYAGVGIYAKNSAAGAGLSIITATGTTVSGGGGIYARNYGHGALTVTANGDVTGTSGLGIFARNSGTGTSISVTTAAGTTVSGGTYGIVARSYGSGPLTITANGNVTGTIGGGIQALNSGAGDLSITANGDVTGTSGRGIFATNSAGTYISVTTAAGTTVSGADGIYAHNFGTGALTITANGYVTGTSGRGIYARNFATGTDLTVTTGLGTTVSGRSFGIHALNSGSGALTITAKSNVTGTAGPGIDARNYGTGLSALSVTTAAVSGSTYGIFARNGGTGALTITANGDVTGTSARGIYARNFATGTDLIVTTAASTTVRGAAAGIFARNYGSGALTITANGNVTGTSGVGIQARNYPAGTDLIVTTAAGTTVTGVTYGIDTRNLGSGAFTITANGDVTAAHDGIYARSSAGAIAITVAATSTVTSTGTAAGDFAIKTGAGPATVDVAGTVAGAMNITGTLTFQPTGIYRIAVTPATATSSTVSGAATLGNATVNAVFANGGYVAKQYTILTAGSIGGTFGALTNTNMPSSISDSLSQDLTHVYLNLTLNFSTPASGGLNGNQNNVANALTNFFNSTGGIPAAFANLSASDLSQAAGQPGAATAQAGIGGVGQFVNAVFDDAFGDNNGQGGATGFAEENSYAPKPKVSRAATEAYAAVTPRDRAVPSFAARWSVWALGYGGNSRVNGDTTAGTSTTTSRIFGTAVGATYRFTPDTQAGFALGGAGASFNLDGGFGGGKADVFNAAAYAKQNFGAAYVAGLLGYSWQDTTTDRTLTIAGTDQLHANFKAQALTARLEGGWRYATPVVDIIPYAALQSTSFYLPAYGETATSGSSTFALSYAAQTVTATRGEFGAKFDKAMLVSTGVFTLKAKAALAHDWNTERAATATFQALPGATFTVNGAQPAADAALTSLGAEMKWRNGWSLAANFDGEFSRTTAGYAGKGTVEYEW
jgi:uncharacterized protein with beta-barrel porin domain